MCLGVPGEVTAVDGSRATVDFWGVEKAVRLDTVDEPVEPGDYILNHVGFAIRRIPESEIDETMALYESFMSDDPDDMLTEDVVDEIEAGGSVPAAAASDHDLDESVSNTPDSDDDSTTSESGDDSNTPDPGDGDRGVNEPGEAAADADDAVDLLDELDIDV